MLKGMSVFDEKDIVISLFWMFLPKYLRSINYVILNKKRWLNEMLTLRLANKETISSWIVSGTTGTGSGHMWPYAAIMVNASFEYLKVGVLFMNTILVSLLILFI